VADPADVDTTIDIDGKQIYRNPKYAKNSVSFQKVLLYNYLNRKYCKKEE